MASENNPRNREYLVPPGSYMYVQDGTSGKIKTNVGPIQVSLTGNDSPMVYDSREFKRMESLEQAVRKSIVAPDGYYVVLMNPAVNPKGEIVHPNEGNQSNAMPELSVGNKVVIQGPCMFALWPGQAAVVIRGHHLRSNQYLVVRVYNEEEARKNWQSARMVTTAKPSTSGSSNEPANAGAAGAGGMGSGSSETGGGISTGPAPAASDLTVGKLLIIKGTEVSFYIPSTGITVEDIDGTYVREAVTLEQLEYCVLLDEDGNKRYVHGPDVVFPEPTESFMTTQESDTTGNKYVANKYRAMELNEIQGLHIKVTETHHDPVLGHLEEGQEVFFTGKQYPIYFPRQEHVIVRYDGKSKHFAVAVPKGDARYLMDRMTSQISLVHGPTMLLPNPVDKIIVRRALSDKECELYYPGNAEALEYNRALREVATRSPTTRQGVVSEGEIERSSRRKDSTGAALRRAAGPGSTQVEAMYSASATGIAPPAASRSMADNSNVSMGNFAGLADEISRASTYNAPRTLTLNNKYEGALKIQPYNNYAVMVTDSQGHRRVEEGPANILLEYDEVLESLAISTGKPKTTDKLLFTAYLRIRNNNVSDVIKVETSDHVEMAFKVIYLVNFVGEDKQKWFAIENYVKFLCDYMRSKLKAAAKQLTIAELYANPLPFVHNVVLGGEGKAIFEENSMEVSDVELLEAVIPDNDVASILRNTQKQTVTRNILLEEKRRNLQATIESEAILARELEVKSETEAHRKKLDITMVGAELALALARYQSAVKANVEKAKAALSEEAVNDIQTDAGLAREKRSREQVLFLTSREQELDIAMLKANAEALVSKFVALQGGFSESLLALSSQEAMAKIAQALSVQQLVGGQDVVEVITRLFDGTGLGKMLEKIVRRSDAPIMNGNGGSKALPEASSTK